MKKIAVIGTGVFGIALAISLAKKNDEVYLWTEKKLVKEEYDKTKNLKSILDVKLPGNIIVTESYSEALKNANVVFIMVACKYVNIVSKEIAKYITKDTPICFGSKGIEEGTLNFVTDIFLSIYKTKNIAILSGPTFAIDVANNEPCAFTIASPSKKCIKKIKLALASDKIKLRESRDMIGVQVCGSVKNVIAIASGILCGLGYQESTQSFLITESLHDIKSLIHGLGGTKKTILSFAGVGDLLMTATSKKSRNFSFGYVIGSSKNKKDIDEYLSKTTVEGYYTLKSIRSLVRKKKIKMPIINLIYDIIVNDKDPNSLVDFLINKN